MAQEFEGVARLGITTLPYIEDPGSAFSVVDYLNAKGYELGLEVYLYHTPKSIENNAGLIKRIKNEPIPAKVKPDVLSLWEGVVFSKAKVTQLHLPFAYDFAQAARQVVMPGRNSPLGNLHHLFHLVAFGWVKDGYAGTIAGAISNPDLVINAHEDVFRKAVKKGGLEDLTRLGKVAVEDYKNPPKTVRELVEPLGVGFTLGLDHGDLLAARGHTIETVLKDEGVRKYTTAIHLAGLDHGVVPQAVLQEIARTPFAHPVTAYLDLHPNNLKGMNPNEELDFWKRQLDFIKSTQPQLV